MHSSQEDVSYNQNTCTKNENIFGFFGLSLENEFLVAGTCFLLAKEGFYVLPNVEYTFLILSSFSERKQSFRENFVIQSINEKATGWVVKCCHRLIFYPLLGETFPHRQDSFTSSWRTLNQQLR